MIFVPYAVSHAGILFCTRNVNKASNKETTTTKQKTHLFSAVRPRLFGPVVKFTRSKKTPKHTPFTDTHVHFAFCDDTSCCSVAQRRYQSLLLLLPPRWRPWHCSYDLDRCWRCFWIAIAAAAALACARA